MSASVATRFSAFEHQLQDAWAAHRGLLMAEQRDPSLRDNPQWKLLRMDAYETFFTP
ncbi:hypothetical protein ACQEPB_00400 [Novosphingobium fluoreni]|uniref:hypothetical protein n=1 Tax=Novosphingobium fluoreni TaxID=1391222 RepID=UPI003DA15E07